ncbi:MAG: 50S ribosomal protein L24 [Pedosphaera sp.]|nr:50S ribosomal protein L24 [Pedosphaera sp.]
MPKCHVKKGDEVVVIAGSGKGRRGKITRVFPARGSVVLEGTDERSRDEGKDERDRLVRPVQHFLRKSQQSPQGGVLWLEGPIHISNVMKVEAYDAGRSKKP